MKPGRSLDALVAEKIFGMKFYKRIGPDGPNPGYEELLDKPDHIAVVYPHYSTEIAAAWEVAQAVADLDEDNDFVIHLSPTKHRECTVEVKYWDKSNPSDPLLAGPFYVVGETAPHAICLAALKAVGR